MEPSKQEWSVYIVVFRDSFPHMIRTLPLCTNLFSEVFAVSFRDGPCFFFVGGEMMNPVWLASVVCQFSTPGPVCVTNFQTSLQSLCMRIVGWWIVSQFWAKVRANYRYYSFQTVGWSPQHVMVVRGIHRQKCPETNSAWRIFLWNVCPLWQRKNRWCFNISWWL